MLFKIRRHFLLHMRRDAICSERPLISSADAVLEVTMATMATMVKSFTVTTFPKVSSKGYKALAPTCARYAAPLDAAPQQVEILPFLCTARFITVRPRIASKAFHCKLRQCACAEVFDASIFMRYSKGHIYRQK